MSISTLGPVIPDADFIDNRLPWDRRNYPEWLRSIQGDSPLLGRSEWEYIAEVRHRIITEAKPSPNFISDRRLMYKLSVMKDNFEEVVRYLRENSECKEYFMITYPSWRYFRDISITQLKDIAKAVNANCKESAASRGAGSSMSLVGGLMTLVPGIRVLRFAGSVLMGLGSLVVLATSVVEFEEFRSKIKEAEKIMLQDKEYSEKLWNWMNDLSHIDEAYNVIKYMNVDMDLKKIASDLHSLYKTASTPESMKMIIEKALPSLKFPSGMITETADVVSMLIATFMLHERYRSMFNLALETCRFKRILYAAGNVIENTAKVSSIVNASYKGSKLTTFQKSRIGIGIALDVLTIMQASKDMESTSKEAEEIEKAAEKLKKEAEIFKKVYEAVIHASVD